MMAAESDREREDKAVDIARAQGAQEARYEGQFTEINRHFEDNNGQIKHLADAIDGMCERLGEMEKREEQRDAIAEAISEAVAEHAKEATAAYGNQVSTRAFFLGLAGLAVSLGSLFAVVA